MSDEGGIFVSVVIEQCHQITRQVLDVIVGYRSRPGRVAVAPLVRDDDVVTRRGEGGHLMTPGLGMLRPAVAEHDGPSRIFPACFEDFELHTVD